MTAPLRLVQGVAVQSHPQVPVTKAGQGVFATDHGAEERTFDAERVGRSGSLF